VAEDKLRYPAGCHGPPQAELDGSHQTVCVQYLFG